LPSPPAVRMSASRSRVRSSVRVATKTRAICRVSSHAVIWPMPVQAPVMRATRPWSELSCVIGRSVTHPC
jgi:hypothetical protein